MHVKINTATLTEDEVAISQSAAEIVRMGFNPSTLPKVDRVKALAAAFISVCEDIKDDCVGLKGGREAAIAITDIQKASMMAVAAGTANL